MLLQQTQPVDPHLQEMVIVELLDQAQFKDIMEL